ncbi:hypothetical protein CHS0354_038927 [Potamilus streckersoni]|uniref:Uncharacterized protein n=1 Tax=Potamilus streckersoni TaxID=2493646 RepID=A0AAE0VM46_9BIVA|nr:hypothetical protein CHS0354_038927 [Potamilus streckersoni]KAK3583318.1 hypothetical protein CHS0354_038927 [Potamilus streckersoni]
MPKRPVVLVTEASQSMGYHLLNLFGNGDIFGPDQTVDLMLCDRKEREAELLGVAMELRDCAFPLVSSVTTICDFCSAFKSADMAVILPIHLKSLTPMSLSFKILETRSFPSLEGALNKHSQNSHFKHTKSVSPKGPMSGAIMIANFISDTYATVTKDSQGLFPAEGGTVEEVHEIPVAELQHAYNMAGSIDNPVTYHADNLQNCMMVICDQDDSNYNSCYDERKPESDTLLSRL